MHFRATKAQASLGIYADMPTFVARMIKVRIYLSTQRLIFRPLGLLFACAFIKGVFAYAVCVEIL